MTDYESLLLQQILREQRALRADLSALGASVQRMSNTLAEQRGARRMAVWVAGGVGSATAFLVGFAVDFIKARLGF